MYYSGYSFLNVYSKRFCSESHLLGKAFVCDSELFPRSSHQSIFFNFKYFSSFSMHTSRHTSSSADNSSKSRAFAGIKRINDFGLLFDRFLTFVGIFNIVVIFHPPCVYYCCTHYYVVLHSIYMFCFFTSFFSMVCALFPLLIGVLLRLGVSNFCILLL